MLLGFNNEVSQKSEVNQTLTDLKEKIRWEVQWESNYFPVNELINKFLNDNTLKVIRRLYVLRLHVWIDLSLHKTIKQKELGRQFE